METHGSIPEDVGRQLLREEDAVRQGVLLDELGVDGILIAHDFPLEDALPFAPSEWEQVFDFGTRRHRLPPPGGTAACGELRELWSLPPRHRTTNRSSTPVRIVENSRLGRTRCWCHPDR